MTGAAPQVKGHDRRGPRRQETTLPETSDLVAGWYMIDVREVMSEAASDE